jgi:hypothetical protein
MAQQINLTQIDTIPPSGYSINLGSESIPFETIYTTNLVVTNVTGITSTTITITGGTGIEVTGSYPDFIITNTASGETITITGGTNIAINGSYPNFGIEFTGTTGSGTPSGNDREIQFNDNGSFGSSTGFTFGTSGELDVRGSAHFGTGTPTLFIGTGEHTVEITATGGSAPLTLIGGSGGVEIWKDAALPGGLPTKAVWYGSAFPGLPADGDIHFATYNTGQTWQDRIIVNNSTGDLSIKSLSGTTTRMVEATSGGTLTATKEIISAYIEDSIIISGLTNDDNWDNNNDFIGEGITGTYQGQNYYDGTYYYTATDDDVWIRLNKKRPPYKVYTALLTQSGGSDIEQILTGDLTIGTTYQIFETDGVSGWDFTNVGAPNNDVGTSFVAIGTTPNSWTSAGLEYNRGAPIVTVLENTIGNIYWTYDDVGRYQANSNGLFLSGKVVAFINNKRINSSYSLYRLNDNILNLDIRIVDTIPFSFDDTLLEDASIEIRVYN